MRYPRNVSSSGHGSRMRSQPAAGVVPAGEFTDRRARAAAAAAQRGLGALVVWSRGGSSVDFYGDVMYLANHHSPFPPNQDTPQWSGRSYSALVLPVDGEPTLVMDLPDRSDSIAVDDVRPTLRVPDTVGEVLKERGLDTAKLGLVGRDCMLLSSYETIEAAVGHPLEVTFADDILIELRAIKSEAEVALLRRAAGVGVGWMNAMMEAVAPGRTEGDVVGEGLRYLAANGGCAYDVALVSGDRSDKFFSRVGIPVWDASRRLAEGDMVHVDAWASIDGYYTDFVRSTVVGRRPTGEQEEVLESAIGLIERVIAGLFPGVTTGEVYDRAAQWLNEHGFGDHAARQPGSGTDFGRLFPAFGHAIGLGLEPPWIIKDGDSVIRENMALAIEVLVGRPGVGGAGFEQNVIVGADGCEVLTATCPPRWWN